MFEDEADGTPRPCDHPIRWYHRLAAWAHARIEALPTALDRVNLHDRLPSWVCEAYERVAFDYPCWACEADRCREYGATIKTDADVVAKWRPRFAPGFLRGDGESPVMDDPTDQGSFGYKTNSPDVEPGDPFAYDSDDEPVDCSNGCPDHDFRRRGCPGGCGGKDCCGGHECDGDCS